MKMRKEVKIGIFTVAILALLYWGINFLKGRDLFNRNMTYYAYYDNVSGIQMSSPIIVQGIRVGAVTGIKFRPDLNNTVEVKFDVKSAYRVPDNSVVRLFTNGIMGGKALEIELGDSPNALPDGATIRSESETSFLELAGSELEALAHEHQIEMNRERCVLTFQILQTETETAFNMLEELVPRAGGDLLVEMDRHTVVFLKSMENVESLSLIHISEPTRPY